MITTQNRHLRTHNTVLNARFDKAQRARLEDSSSFLHYHLRSRAPQLPKALSFATLSLKRTLKAGSGSHLLRGYANAMLGTSTTADLVSAYLGTARTADTRTAALPQEDADATLLNLINAHPSALLSVAKNALACARQKHTELSLVWNSANGTYRGTHAFVPFDALCDLVGSAQMVQSSKGRALHLYLNDAVRTRTGIDAPLFSIKRKGADSTDTHASQVQLTLNMRTLKKLVHAHAHMDPEQYPIAGLHAVHISDAQNARTLAY